jgi:hypothetical protein
VKYLVFTAPSMKTNVLCNAAPCILVDTDVSEVLTATIIRAKIN